jgi:luciferase family oxidoreductase group 1
MVPFSVLDLSPIVAGGTAADALHRSRELAQHVERLGFHRFWLAEHHNMPGIASAATSVVIAHVAAGTSTIRVGAGGIMLPNHSPLAIAEQFGTLEALFPGRIDLGVGRAPGSDQPAARALRKGRADASDKFPEDVVELMAYFADANEAVRAVPGAGMKVPVWILGSSLFGAQLAAVLGLPFAFASHFAPDHLDEALRLYREHFKPSAALARPYALAAIGAYLADTDAEAVRLATSWQQSFLALRRGNPIALPPPIDDIAAQGSAFELANLRHAGREAVVGTPATVREKIAAFIARTQVDELMVVSAIHDPSAKHHSFTLLQKMMTERT